jgi:hypothetical protein
MVAIAGDRTSNGGLTSASHAIRPIRYTDCHNSLAISRSRHAGGSPQAASPMSTTAAGCFTSADEFQRDARTLLDRVHAGLTAHGFDTDEAKTDVAWIFALERPWGPSKAKAAE